MRLYAADVSCRIEPYRYSDHCSSRIRPAAPHSKATATNKLPQHWQRNAASPTAECTSYSMLYSKLVSFSSTATCWRNLDRAIGLVDCRGNRTEAFSSATWGVGRAGVRCRRRLMNTMRTTTTAMAMRRMIATSAPAMTPTGRGRPTYTRSTARPQTLTPPTDRRKTIYAFTVSFILGGVAQW